MSVGLSHSAALLAHGVCKAAKSVEIQSGLYLAHTISLTDRLLSAYYRSLTVIIKAIFTAIEPFENRWRSTVLCGSIILRVRIVSVSRVLLTLEHDCEFLGKFTDWLIQLLLCCTALIMLDSSRRDGSRVKTQHLFLLSSDFI